jgi:hypothetical protein
MKGTLNAWKILELVSIYTFLKTVAPGVKKLEIEQAVEAMVRGSQLIEFSKMFTMPGPSFSL